MKFIFPYAIRFREDGRLEVFPAAEIFVFGRSGRGLRATFHLDSGATTSILPAADAVVLGLDARDGKKMLVLGISGTPLTGYLHSVRIQFNGLKLRVPVPVIFVVDAAIPRILGRQGVFPRFGILFDEAKRRIGLLERRSERKSIERLFPRA